jgi:aryl-alcohol dehydrogenase-like predicted oxidoreductase
LKISAEDQGFAFFWLSTDVGFERSSFKGAFHMQKRKLGNSGLEIAPFVFGTNVFGWSVDEAASFRILDAFVDAGFDCIDTADVYPRSRAITSDKSGESETIIGRWLKKSGKRDKVVIATKLGLEMGQGKKGLSKDYILSAVEGSLRRLQTDRIDLYQAHTQDLDTPIEETLEMFGHLIMHGKVRVIGASNYDAPNLEDAIQKAHRTGSPAYQTLQPKYNLYDRGEFEAELQDICVSHNLGVIPYSSLASGFLTGKYRSEKDAEGTARSASIANYLNERGFRILKALDTVSEELRASNAAVALAWLLARPGITAPIASATSVEQLNELTKAVELTLSPAQIDKLNRASGI